MRLYLQASDQPRLCKLKQENAGRNFHSDFTKPYIRVISPSNHVSLSVKVLRIDHKIADCVSLDSCASSWWCDWITSRFTSSTSWLDYVVNHLCLSAVFPLILFTANIPDKVFPYTVGSVVHQAAQVLKSLFLLCGASHTFTMFPLNKPEQFSV